SVVLATVGVPPSTETAPPLTKICPAALRLMVVVPSPLSSNTDSKPALGENLALIAMVVVLSKVWPRGAMRVGREQGRIPTGLYAGQETDRALLRKYFSDR